jgi:hypothetical protein
MDNLVPTDLAMSVLGTNYGMNRVVPFMRLQ